MTKDEIKGVLEQHKHWLNEDCEGWEYMRANLSGADLYGADLSCANLSGADLSGANLSGADLSGADLYGAYLSDADLSCANLSGADLSCADLSCANLYGVNLSNITTNYLTVGLELACPEEGSFIGYKKAHGCLVKLLIPEDAKRSSGTTRKCRCDKAKVLAITEIETGKPVDKISSDRDKDFIYQVGYEVSVNNFCENRWIECAEGIHFFMAKNDALSYQ